MKQARRKQIVFDEYKTLKDEIIAVSKQRYENILTKRLAEFRKDMMIDINQRFKDIDKRLSEMRRLTGLGFIVLAAMMTLFKFIK